MPVSQHTVTQLIVHRLVKEADRPASLVCRPAACALDAVAVRLVERLCGQYESRSAKGFGRFEEDEEAFPLARWLRELVSEQGLDFVAFSGQVAQHLKAIADEEELEQGGLVIVARIDEGGADCLWIALVAEEAGVAVSGGLDVSDCLHVDFAGLQAAGRIDLDGWRRGDERYIGFLRGRGKGGAFFKRFLGCSDVVVALQETKKLVATLSHFAEQQQLEPTRRDSLLERAHDYLDSLGENGETVSFEELAQEVYPEQPARLGSALNAPEACLVSGFVPNRRAIRPLVRFSASGEQWKVEFDRSSLHSGAVHYDPATDTLVLAGVPDYLKRMLEEG